MIVIYTIRCIKGHEIIDNIKNMATDNNVHCTTVLIIRSRVKIHKKDTYTHIYIYT